MGTRAEVAGLGGLVRHLATVALMDGLSPTAVYLVPYYCRVCGAKMIVSFDVDYRQVGAAPDDRVPHAADCPARRPAIGETVWYDRAPPGALKA